MILMNRIQVKNTVMKFFDFFTYDKLRVDGVPNHLLSSDIYICHNLNQEKFGMRKVPRRCLVQFS